MMIDCNNWLQLSLLSLLQNNIITHLIYIYKIAVLSVCLFFIHAQTVWHMGTKFSTITYHREGWVRGNSSLAGVIILQQRAH